MADGERHLSTNKTARYVAHNTVFMARLLRANPIPTNLKRIMEDAQAVSDV